MIEPIGGFFELELAIKKEYYPNLLRFNYARHVISTFFKKKNIQKVWIPTFICEVVEESLLKEGLIIQYYHINSILRPVLPQIKPDEGLIVVNYLGLSKFNEDSILFPENTILDNSQAFFDHSNIFSNIVYSPRKFFGIPDGAYLKTDIEHESFKELERFNSIEFAHHLWNRIENGAEKTFDEYQNIRKRIKSTSLKRMSNLSERLLQSIAYTDVLRARNENFSYLNGHLERYNELKIEEFNGALSYPLLVERGEELKQELIDNKFFVSTYWPGVLKNNQADEYDKFLTKNLINIPIDQRYSLRDMLKVIEFLKRSL